MIKRFAPLALLALFALGCTAPASNSAAANAAPAPGATPVPTTGQVQTASGLQYTILTPGSGALAAKSGDQVSVNYTGWLTNGSKFDSSFDRNQPFSFQLGQGNVIKGWDEGVAGMAVGEKRRLIIPGALGYGPNGTPDGKIPPNATLVFEVQLLQVNGKP